MPLTRTSGPRPIASSRIRWLIAALLTSYASLPAFGTTALAELVSTIDAGSFCALQDLRRFLREHEVRRHVDLQRLAPDGSGRRPTGSGVGIDRRGVDDAVEPAELQHRRAHRRRDRVARRQVERRRLHHLVSTTTPAASSAASSAAAPLAIGDDDVSAALRDLQRHLAADAAAAADDDDDLAAELLLGRHPLQLGFFERPVLDPERLGARQRHVVVEGLELLRLLRPPHLRHTAGWRRSRLRARSRRCITWMALTKNSVVIRASRLSLPNPNSPRPGMTTTDGLLSRSAGEPARRTPCSSVA